jgi:hypothetical protein
MVREQNCNVNLGNKFFCEGTRLLRFVDDCGAGIRVDRVGDYAAADAVKWKL